MDRGKRITLAALGLNLLLFVVKLIGGLLSNSLAVLSDAFNSLTDIIASTAIFFAVNFSSKEADKEHPFGHHRAEPLAGVIVAIFAGILGFEIVRTAITGLLNHEAEPVGFAAIVVLVFTIVVKSIMSFIFSKHGKVLRSPAIRAIGIDARNDVLVSSIALVGVVVAFYGNLIFDDIAAIAIGVFILFSGYKIGMENIDYLMGKAPPEEYLDRIKKIVRKIKGVKGLNDVRAHYVGSFIHIEIHIEVDKKISTEKSHGIGKDVQRAVEQLAEVDKAFIHIDPR